jgi:subtilase family serine protease
MTEEDKTEINYEAEMESVQAALVLANSRIAEYEAVEAQRIEDVRTTLVSKATELGMSGHEDLSTPTLETLIASWEASHPEPTPVEMTPVESEVKPVADAAVASEDTPMVANYLNGRMVSNKETMYAKAYNAWASAWNQTLAGDEKGRMKAHRYDTLKEMN